MAGTALTIVRIGTAGWALPKAMRNDSSPDRSVLEHYAAVFNAVEINSSFYRPHRRSTYERWRASVADSFRFSVKVPRQITHELGLKACEKDTIGFIENVRGLGDKLAVVLVQLPPSHVFDRRVAAAFFRLLRRELAAHIVCEARNPTWFADAVSALLKAHRVTRVTAHPVPLGCGFVARPNPPFTYLRLHGSPRMYYSAYSRGYLRKVAAAACTATETWCIFDNTAAGAAWPDAANLQRFLSLSDASTG